MNATKLASKSQSSAKLAASDITERQMQFYRRTGAGCAFAAAAAKDPERYGWRQYVLAPDSSQIQCAARDAVECPDVSTASFIFPSVDTLDGVVDLIKVLSATPPFFIESDKYFGDYRCISIRAKIGLALSWVSGFGPFADFPVTRRSPFVEIAFRVKPRPPYKMLMKKSPDGIIHLADLDFLGDLSWAAFQTLWHASIRKTAEMLGHSPDLKSAAKTTFALPL